MGHPAMGRDQIENGLGVVASVGDERLGRRKAFDERRNRSLVGGLAGGQHDPQGQAILIDHDVDLGAQSSTRTADGVIFAPFFPPAACWCARTMELSIRCSDWGEAADRASKTRSQTPALAQRL